MAKEQYDKVICPTCWRKVNLRKGHEERDLEEHMLEDNWNPQGIIGDAIWGK